ncbi:MAG: hypothetical protein LBH11_07155 [Propionibacteriaceae bacterium]|jgi:hypothetical protein|nr:hypothetical protein [Propionibacteriaceae bacterium]
MVETGVTADLNSALAAFEARFRAYLDEIAALKERTANIRRAATLWSQRRPFADDPIHAAALSELRSLADAVSLALRAHPSDREPLAQAVALVLAEKDLGQAEYWPLVSLEGLVEPWLANLEPARLGELHRNYAKANPKSRCLPNQRRIHKEFERILKAR